MERKAGDPSQVTVVENGVRRVVEVRGLRRPKVPSAWLRKKPESGGATEDVVQDAVQVFIENDDVIIARGATTNRELIAKPVITSTAGLRKTAGVEELDYERVRQINYMFGKLIVDGSLPPPFIDLTPDPTRLVISADAIKAMMGYRHRMSPSAERFIRKHYAEQFIIELRKEPPELVQDFMREFMGPLWMLYDPRSDLIK